MSIAHSIDSCLGQGVTRPELDMLLAKLSPILARLKQRSDVLSAPLLALPFKDLTDINTRAQAIQKRFKHLIVAGSGGSGLSGRMLTLLKAAPVPVALHFIDNIDPHAMEDCLNRIDFKDSCFLIVSKSGTTVETLSQFYVLLNKAIAVLGKNAGRDHFIIITTPGDNPMRASAQEHNIPVLDHDPDIGGRFSPLSNVGLLPAAVAGLDIAALCKGAQDIVKELDAAATPGDCAPALGAALQYAFMGKGRNISVMLPYSDRLSGFSSWYRQVWAESLGKGGKGSTPIRAVGTTDQHSQLQLYLDGPKDKLYHLITIKRAGTGQPIQAPNVPELGYLQGKTTGDVMAAEQKATFETLIRNQCPVRHFELATLGEKEMGALVMHFILEIIFMADLLQVNAFDQPAVEEGKKLAREYLLTGNL